MADGRPRIGSRAPTKRWTNPEAADIVTIAHAARITRSSFRARCRIRIGQPGVTGAITSTVRI